eukprot:6199457-Pleurochrysis_carterae.AAC.1
MEAESAATPAHARPCRDKLRPSSCCAAAARRRADGGVARGLSERAREATCSKGCAPSVKARPLRELRVSLNASLRVL